MYKCTQVPKTFEDQLQRIFAAPRNLSHQSKVLKDGRHAHVATARAACGCDIQGVGGNLGQMEAGSSICFCNPLGGLAEIQLYFLNIKNCLAVRTDSASNSLLQH